MEIPRIDLSDVAPSSLSHLIGQKSVIAQNQSQSKRLLQMGRSLTMRSSSVLRVLAKAHWPKLSQMKWLRTAQIEKVTKELFPNGTGSIIQSEVLRAVFLHLKRNNSGDNVGR
jgi:hypothetical protein